MACIIIALNDVQNGKKIKNLLVQNGFSEIVVCASGSAAIAETDMREEGIVISSFKLVDMMYTELKENLPDYYKMLLLAPGSKLADRMDEDVLSLELPFRAYDLYNTVELMLGSFTRDKKPKSGPGGQKRSPEEEAMINEAKALLMSRNNMSEKEAHRYIQKCSMDASRSFAESARMILTMR